METIPTQLEQLLLLALGVVFVTQALKTAATALDAHVGGKGRVPWSSRPSWRWPLRCWRAAPARRRWRSPPAIRRCLWPASRDVSPRPARRWRWRTCCT